MQCEKKFNWEQVDGAAVGQPRLDAKSLQKQRVASFVPVPGESRIHFITNFVVPHNRSRAGRVDIETVPTYYLALELQHEWYNIIVGKTGNLGCVRVVLVLRPFQFALPLML